MYCIKCGKEINEGALYCRYCGAPQEMKKADDDNAIQSSTKATADGEGTESGQTEKRHQEKETESIIKKKSFLPWLIGGAAVVSILVIVIAAITTVAIYNTPMNRYNRQLSLGNRYVDELDYERAIAAYRAAIEIDPNNPEAYKALADLYIAIDDNESALEVALSGVDATGDSGLKTLASDIEIEMNAPVAAEPSDEGNDEGNSDEMMSPEQPAETRKTHQRLTILNQWTKAGNWPCVMPWKHTCWITGSMYQSVFLKRILAGRSIMTDRSSTLYTSMRMTYRK